MKIIGRKREIGILEQCVMSKRPEFVVVYGRRRVGKTYLVKEYFNNRFAFYATGISKKNMKGQLRAFNKSLIEYGCEESAIPSDWFEAFSRLRKLLESEKVYRDPLNNKMVVFLDEMPWMDTARSDFKSALDHFWNSWASAKEDMLLIVCGSATSWIINNLLKSREGFYNRITRQIRLMPFSLKECEALVRNNDIVMTRTQIVECYMTFGGIPYYLNMLDPRLSLAQNIDELCFKEYGSLRFEYENLFSSLFKNPGRHYSIVRTLALKKEGVTRSELAENEEIGGGSALTEALEELAQCGFIRKYSNYYKKKNDAMYQLVDPFMLFSQKYLSDEKRGSWLKYINSPGYNAWRGNAFEMVCLNHVLQIKRALGVEGVDSQEYSWRSKEKTPGAQIDLLIDRSDGVINLCEMKYTNGEYEIDSNEYAKIVNRLTVFQNEVEPKKAIHVTLVSANGVKRNKYVEAAQNVITAEDLFE